MQDFLDMTNQVFISHDHHFVHEQAIAAEAIKPQASASAAASASHTVKPALAFSQQPSATATSTATPTIDDSKHAFRQRGPPDAQEVVLPGERQGARNWTSTACKPFVTALKLKTEFVAVSYQDCFVKAGSVPAVVHSVADPCFVSEFAFALVVDFSTIHTTRESGCVAPAPKGSRGAVSPILGALGEHFAPLAPATVGADVSRLSSSTSPQGRSAHRFGIGFFDSCYSQLRGGHGRP